MKLTGSSNKLLDNNSVFVGQCLLVDKSRVRSARDTIFSTTDS